MKLSIRKNPIYILELEPEELDSLLVIINGVIKLSDSHSHVFAREAVTTVYKIQQVIMTRNEK